jgi:hypothetical protein
MLLVASGAGIIAPSLGVTAPVAPIFPSFPNLSSQGNLTATFPFDETHNCTVGTSTLYTDFNPDKSVEVSSSGLAIKVPGFLGIFWNTEPSYYINGTATGALYAQVVVDNANATGSFFIVDLGNLEFEAYIQITPITGYTTLLDSWNIGHGFTVRIYGATYQPPAWTDQAVAYLTFAGAIIAYILYYIWFMLSTLGLFFVLLGLSPAIGTGIIMLVTIVFIGAIILFIRGVGDGSSGK